MSKESVNEYDTIVVGAGIAGLTCGVALAKQGHKTLIIEAQEKPGGYCTSFTRGAYTFDSAVHYIQGARDNGWLGLIMKDLGIREELESHRLDPVYKLVYPSDSITIPADFQEYVRLLSERFPEEGEGIVKLFNTIDRLMAEMLRLPTTLNVLSLLSFPLRFPLTYKYSKMTFAEMMAEYLSDPRLKSIVSSGWLCLGLPPSQVSAFQMAGYIYGAHVLGCYYPRGGAQALPSVLAKALSDYGGVLQLGTTVTNILVENGRVEGVETSDGNRINAKSVVSNIDARRTFLDLVGPEELSARYLRRLENMKPSMTFFQVWLGIDVNPADEGVVESEFTFYSSYDYDDVYERLLRGGFTDGYLVGIPSLLDQSLAPNGHHVMSILCPASYDFENRWGSKGGERGDEYRRLKESVSSKIVKDVETAMPWISGHVVVSEAATPITLERYTGNYKGAAYGWAHSPDQFGRNRLQLITPIKGLYLAGNWTVPGVSTAIAAVSGRRAAEIVIQRH